MFTAYDWMKQAREQNNFRKDSGEFAKNLREKEWKNHRIGNCDRRAA